jgi:KaiC/GvpD/RAD55 family RecA-like ATPase
MVDKKTPPAKVDFERVKTGVPGLDELIEGGIPKDFIILVAGSSGTGKTTMLMKFLAQGVQDGEKCVYIGLGESEDVISKCMARYGLDLQALAEDNKLTFAAVPTMEFKYLKEIVQALDDNVKRLVIDPISALVFRYEEGTDLRENLRELVELIREKGVTCMVSTEVLEGSPSISRFGIEDFLADGIIVLYYIKEGAKRFRGLEIRKMRGTHHSDLIHLYKLGDKGFQVYPNQKVFPD